MTSLFDSVSVRRVAIFSCLVFMFVRQPLAAEETYDLIIRGGKIVDGTGNPLFVGDVAVRGDQIAALGRSISQSARREIDASGKVVCPGFIDIHSHSDYLILEDGDAQSKIRQRVTTDILGEGSSVAPLTGMKSARTEVARGETYRWSTFDEYFRMIESAGVSINIASYVGLNNVWECVMGDRFDRPTDDQLEQMKRLVSESMQQGALGLSSQVMMPPGSLATTDDIVELCEVVARFHGIYSIHIRNEGTGVLESVNEAIEIGERAGVPVDIIHLKIADQRLWGRMHEVISLINEARRRGVNVQANVYAHHSESDMALALQQPWYSVGSDGSAYTIDGTLRRGNPHPRNFGTFPKVLGNYVRRQGLLSLEEAVRKLTSLNAAKIGLAKRGILAVGYAADITVFDPERIRDRATYTDPFQYNEGVHYVLVNGEVVLDNGEHTGARPGRGLRLSVDGR